MKANHLVPPSYAFRVNAQERATRANIYVDGKSVWVGDITVTNGVATLPPIAVRYGRSVISVALANAWGSKGSTKVPVYQLGKTLPSYWRFVLIDKSDFYLYYINGRCVVARYPIATGTPWAPTPTGTFRLWYPQPSPNAVWGIFRMNLQRKVSGGFVRTQYYVHGTNDPSSIGTMASHGCVRMYNSDLRRFANQLSVYSKRPYTVIRY